MNHGLDATITGRGAANLRVEAWDATAVVDDLNGGIEKNQWGQTLLIVKSNSGTKHEYEQRPNNKGMTTER